MAEIHYGVILLVVPNPFTRRSSTEGSKNSYVEVSKKLRHSIQLHMNTNNFNPRKWHWLE